MFLKPLVFIDAFFAGSGDELFVGFGAAGFFVHAWDDAFFDRFLDWI